MANFDDVLCEVNAIVEEYVGKMEYTRAERCGLDARCGRVYVGREGIAVDKSNDRTLQYYGGFEYVDKDCRHELGDYVFYSTNDDRVQGHVEEFFEEEDADVD